MVHNVLTNADLCANDNIIHQWLAMGYLEDTLIILISQVKLTSIGSYKYNLVNVNMLHNSDSKYETYFGYV